MANFTAAINCLVAERDRVFLVRVSEDYGIPFEELQKKYLETAEEAIKVPRKYKKREPKLVEVTTAEGETVIVPTKKEPAAPKEKKICESQTSKKEPCKFPALRGGCFCKRHQRQQDEKQDGVAPVPKPKKEVVKKQEQPLHTHNLNEVSADCDLCASHGNPLKTDDDDFELVIQSEAEQNSIPEQVASKSTAERLASILAESDSDSEYASESDDVENWQKVRSAGSELTLGGDESEYEDED
jgi:hypothetical protein